MRDCTYCILIVDDNPNNLFTLRTLLNEHLENIQIIEANSGQAALRLMLDEYAVDLILLDVQMPEMDGFETAQLILSFKATAHIPIVFLSAAYKSEQFQRRGIDVGATDYLTKPIDSQQLITRIRLYLRFIKQERQHHLELEQKVAERTQELQQQTIALEQANNTLLQLNREKNEFLGIAAHDLKNPLQAIQGSAELIEMTVSMEEFASKVEVMEFANMINVSSARMFDLITNLLDVNVIESDKMKVHLQQTNILLVLQEVVNEYTKKATAKNITVHFTPEQDIYPAYVDPNTVRQILDNLISNAVKYSPLNKAIYIRIATQVNMIRIEIQDQGQGLSKEEQTKLFGKFTRLSAKPTAGEHSTGLGLFIVKKLVNVLSGHIWCESELGQGATFILELPIQLVTDEINIEARR